MIMEQLFKRTYRIPSVQYKTWNYANEGMYFVTICTKNRVHYFGEIVPPPVEPPCLAAPRPIADDWPAGLEPPNITGPRLPLGHDWPTSSEPPSMAALRGTEIAAVAYHEWFKTLELRPDMNIELGDFIIMPNHIHGIIMIGPNTYNTQPFTVDDITVYKNQFVPQSKNLASIIRGYKSAVSMYARMHDIEFEWQSRFHDRVIRSLEEYVNVSYYILNNPDKWLDIYDKA